MRSLLDACNRLLASFTALCLVCSAPVGAQDATVLDALFNQAAQLETGASKDYAGAARLYEQAARQGHTPSMVRLGYLRETGTGVSSDPASAFELYTQAAKGGNLDGEFMLAMSYMQGIGTGKNPTAARQWLLQPAGHGHQYAEYALGIMLDSGEGGPRKETAARRWLDKASQGPDHSIAIRAASLRDKIDRDLLAPNNSGTVVVSLLLFMAVVGGGLGGGGGGTPYPGNSDNRFPTGGTDIQPPPCRPVPIPMTGTPYTPNGRDLITPGPSTMMGGC